MSENKKLTALILGGYGDIGSAIAHKLRDEGCNVVTVGRSDFDLGRPDQIDAYFLNNTANFDLLIHSGGLNYPKKFKDLSEYEIRECVDVNLHGFLSVTRHCLPYWEKTCFGRVLIISSLYGSSARKGRLPYVISKHALNGAMKTLALELSGHGVLVNSLSPGFVATKMTYKNNTNEIIDKIVEAIPVGRMGAPEEIAAVAAFLCSTQNSYISGQDIVVDGGYSAGGFHG